MEFSISILKDAAAAIDKLVGALSKLGTAILNGTKNTVQLFDYMNARDARSALTTFNSTVPRLMQTQALLLRPAMNEFIASPTQGKWISLMSEVKLTQHFVSEATSSMNKADSLLATEPFFKDLIGAMIIRKKTLEEISKMPMPSTPEEIAAAKEFFLSYDKLILELEKTGNELRQYVAAMQEKKVYPPDPPRRRGHV